MDKDEEAGVNFIRHTTPEEVWMQTLTAVMPDEDEPVVTVAPRRRRLRRMQSQNFVQRAVHNVIELFRREKEVA